MHSSEKMFLTFFNVGLSGPPKMSDFIMYSVQVWACTLYMRWIFLRSAFDRGWRIWWFKLIKNFTKKIYFLTGQNCLRKKKSWKKYFFVSCLDLPYALCQCSCPLPPHTTAYPPAYKSDLLRMSRTPSFTHLKCPAHASTPSTAQQTI